MGNSGSSWLARFLGIVFALILFGVAVNGKPLSQEGCCLGLFLIGCFVFMGVGYVIRRGKN